MIYMTMTQAEDLDIFGHDIEAKVVILTDAQMNEHLRNLLR